MVWMEIPGQAPSPSFLVSIAERSQPCRRQRFASRLSYPLTFLSLFPGKKGLKSLFLCPNLVRTLSKETAMERLEAKQVKGHT